MGHLIAAARLHTPDGDGPGWVDIDRESGTITAVGSGAPRRDPDDWVDGLLAPGLVDAQLNGAFGSDFADADDADWERIVAALPRHGVTAVVPTFITAPVADLAEQLGEYRRVRERLAGRDGAARLLPAHVEGPFLAADRRGAHRVEHLLDPTTVDVDELVAAGSDSLGYVTLAPERVGGLDAVRRFVAAGVRVSVGHSDADAATVSRAADAGASLVTHLFNAQRPFAHRDPGVSGVALTDRRLTVGVVADLHHVDPIAIDVAFRCAPGRVMLVTDGIAALGMPAGEYVLGGEPVTVAEGSPPMRRDGTIAGAAVPLDACVGNVVRTAGVSRHAAVEAATAVPARAVGALGSGVIRVGAHADLVELDPDDLSARATWIGGVRVTPGP